MLLTEEDIITIVIYAVVVLLILIGVGIAYCIDSEILLYLFQVLALVFVPLLLFKIEYHLLIIVKL